MNVDVKGSVVDIAVIDSGTHIFIVLVVMEIGFCRSQHYMRIGPFCAPDSPRQSGTHGAELQERDLSVPFGLSESQQYIYIYIYMH